MGDGVQGAGEASSDPAALDDIEALVEQIHGLLDRLAAADVTRCADGAVVELAASVERAVTRLMWVGDRQIVEASNRGLPARLGYRNLTNFMNVGLRVSDPARRRRQMEATASFTQITGGPGEPTCPSLARSFAAGAVGPARVRSVVEVMDRIPSAVAHDVRVAAEETMAGLAAKHTPREITELGTHLLARLDPDGDLVEDSDRTRRRSLWLNRQDLSKMSKLTGYLTPVARARLEVLLAAWAAPGMNNPDDAASPRGHAEDTDADVLAAAVARDCRSQAQRNHDALEALLAAVFEDGMLGRSHRGLPVQVIVKADLRDLLAMSGVGTTASGSLLPVSDVVKLAAQSHPFLAVFDDASEVPLYFGRTRRLASQGQRLASFARTGGEWCSHPDCDQWPCQLELGPPDGLIEAHGTARIESSAAGCRRGR